MTAPIPHAFRQITIKDKQYQIVLLKGREGFTTALALGKLIAPIVGSAFDGMKHDDLIHGAPKTFQDMAALLINQLDKTDVEAMVFDKLLRQATVQGQPLTDQHWMGNFSDLIELVMFALKENFGDFFGENGFKARFQETVQMISNPT